MSATFGRLEGHPDAANFDCLDDRLTATGERRQRFFPELKKTKRQKTTGKCAREGIFKADQLPVSMKTDTTPTHCFDR